MRQVELPLWKIKGLSHDNYAVAQHSQSYNVYHKVQF